MAAAEFPPNIRSCSGNLAVGAFSADDMYAFPTDAGEGLVYITDINGSVWAGRSAGWTRIATASMSPGFQPVDACWFNDRLYLGAQEGIWTIDAAKGRLVRLQEMEPDAPNATNSGRLDISGWKFHVDCRPVRRRHP